MLASARMTFLAALAALTACSALVDTDPGRLGGAEDGGARLDAAGCAAGCDDGVACTDDRCEADACVHEPNDARCGSDERCNPARGCVPLRCATDADCDDGNPCNGVEACGGPGADPVTGCTTGAPLVCDDLVPCTSDRCDPSRGCVHTPIDAACDDRVSCTVDRCDPVAGCINTPNDGRCDDGRCFSGGRCDRTVGCVGGSAVECDDGDPCTVGSCEPDRGCVHEPVDADGDGYPAASVGGRACAGGTDCDDTNPAIHPGATEICDGVDNDCSGAIDDVPVGCDSDLPDTCASATEIPLAATAGGGRGGRLTGSFVGLRADYQTLCVTRTSPPRSATGGTPRGSSPDAIHYFDLPSGTWDVTIDTQGSSGDTVLAVATTCGQFDLGGLGCNDDVAGYTWSRVMLHRLSGPFIGNTRVYVLVEPYGTAASGTYALNVQATNAMSGGCGQALSVQRGGTVISFGGVIGLGGETGSCQSDSERLAGEQRFFLGNTAGVLESYSRDFRPDLYVRTRCSESGTETACVRGESIGGGVSRARLEISSGGTAFVDGMTSNAVHSLYYDPR
ncbi:MAG: hypothetical protein KF901_09750 [Myxococcales bacterium]|nr:hypothetical protein [Myxococcales bacterium]